MVELACRRASYYNAVAPWFVDLLDSVAFDPLLTRTNERLLRAIRERLGFKVPIRYRTDFLERAALLAIDPTDRLATLAVALGATR